MPLFTSTFPDFPEKRWPMTIRQIAGHTAGIRHYLGDFAPLTWRLEPTGSSQVPRWAPTERGKVAVPSSWLLGQAVAASSCFPPVFQPMRISQSIGEWTGSLDQVRSKNGMGDRHVGPPPQRWRRVRQPRPWNRYGHRTRQREPPTLQAPRPLFSCRTLEASLRPHLITVYPGG